MRIHSLLASCAMIILAVEPVSVSPISGSSAARSQGNKAHVAFGQPELLPGYVIYVDAQNPAAADRNQGTKARPLKTISRAAQVGAAYNARGSPVTILIHPGMYREAISVPPGGTTASLTFQATARGKAVISGSDVWRVWTPFGNRGIYTHPWPYAWGLSEVPSGWPSLKDIVRRREMVFVDGQLLTQVLDLAQMRQGTFYVDETAHLIYISPLNDADPNAATVEVATRDVLFAADGRTNLAIRGLVFQHAATALDGSAVRLNATKGSLVEDVTFRWNNWSGLSVDASSDGIVRRSVSNHNGARGMSDWKNKHLLYEDNETSYNNWRGSWGDFLGWTTAGIKSLRLHNGVFRRHRAVGNLATGFWLDFDNQNVVVEDGIWCDNQGGGFIEGSQGPITVARTIICANKDAGLLVSVSQQVVLRDSVLYGNKPRQQFEINDLRSGTVDNWETGQTMTLRTQSWTLCGNAFVSLNRDQFLLSVPDWDFFRDTLKASDNVYWNPHRRDVFWLRSAPSVGRALDLAGWQKFFGQDLDSVFAEPRFKDPGRLNFTPLPGSPLRKC